MAERTLADPLSGYEIKRIILDEVEKRMNGDCTLSNDLAYAGFTAKFEIKISFTRSLVPPTLVWGVKEEKAPEGGEVVEEKAEINDSYTSPAPDVARQEHNLPIPVMVQTPTGPQRKRVTITQPKPRG